MPKISKYPAASSVNDADTGVIVQGGVTKRVLMSVLKAFCGGSATPPPTPGTANDFQVAEGSPLAWVTKTAAQVKAILGIGGDVPAATAANDVMMGGGSPVGWVKKTLAEVKAIFGIEKATMLVMLLDKDVAIAAGDNLGNVQVPVPRDMIGKNLSADSRVIISPLGTASTSGAVTFNIVRHRPSSSPVAVDMTTTSPILTIAQDGKTSGSAPVDAANDDLADGDFLSLSCESPGTGAKGPLWMKVVAE